MATISLKEETVINGVINNGVVIPNEIDPTVPAHVKAITEEDITKWNEGAEIDTSNIYTKEEIDNKGFITEEQVDNKGFLTETSLTNYATKEDLNNKADITHSHSEYITETILNEKGYLTQEDIGDIDVDLTDYYTKSDIDNKNYQTEENVDELIGYALENRMGILSESVESPYYFYDSFYSDPLKNLKAGAYYTNGSFKLSFEAPNTSSVPNETTLFEKNSIVYINIVKNGSTYYYLINDITGLAYDITIANGTITEVIRIEPVTKDYVDNLFNSIINGDEVSY